jgi:hypothetical protein
MAIEGRLVWVSGLLTAVMCGACSGSGHSIDANSSRSVSDGTGSSSVTKPSETDGASAVDAVQNLQIGAQNLDVTWSSPMLIGSHSDLARISAQDVPSIDSPVVTFMQGSERRFITTSVKWFSSNGENDFHVYHALTAGSFEQPFSRLLQTKEQWNVFPNFRDFPGRWWIVNTYQDSSGILAFVHVEFARGLKNSGKQLSFGTTYLGLAFSTDGGITFKYLGNVVAPKDLPVDHNIEAAPYVIKGGDFYVYFLDVGGVAVAKANRDQVMAAARGERSMPAWEKWNGGSWTTGLGGASTPVGVTGITHSDAAFSTVTNRFYMATTTQKKGADPSYISLWESTDALSWQFLKRMEPLNDVSLGWQYLSIVDKSGTDNGVVGREFRILVGKDPNNISKSELWRIDVDLVGGVVAPYVGIFRASGAVNYSNGSAYCYYRDMQSFRCMTKLNSADQFPDRPDLLKTLIHGGQCAPPPACR